MILLTLTAFYLSVIHHLRVLCRAVCKAWSGRAARTGTAIVHRRASAIAGDYRPAPHRRSGGKPKPRWAVEAVLELYAAGGGKSHRQVAAEFNRLYAGSGMTVSDATVYAWRQKYAGEMEAVRAATRNRVPRHAPRNRRWCVDATGKADAGGEVHVIFGIIDYGTRMSIMLKRMADQTAEALLAQVLLAAAEFGKPRCIRTDNAAVFRSAAFRAGLAAAGIRQEFSAPGKPWQNGRIERKFLTLKQKLNWLTPNDGVALDRLLAEFRYWYNQIRPHQHLYGHTPHEAWHGINPYLSKPKQGMRFAGWDGLLTGFCLRR